MSCNSVRAQHLIEDANRHSDIAVMSDALTHEGEYFRSRFLQIVGFDPRFRHEIIPRLEAIVRGTSRENVDSLVAPKGSQKNQIPKA